MLLQEQVIGSSIVQLDADSIVECSRVKHTYSGGVESRISRAQGVITRGPESDAVGWSVGDAKPAASRWWSASPVDVVDSHSLAPPSPVSRPTCAAREL